MGFRWTVSKWYSDVDEKWWQRLQEKLHLELVDHCSAFIYQLEWTDCTDTHTCGNWHFQGWMKLRDKKRVKQMAILLNEDFEGINVQPASVKGCSALQRYCMKGDTRQAGPWADKRIYMGEDLPVQLEGWQIELDELYDSSPDDRSVIWINNHQGSGGKSKFCKYMCFHKDCLKLSYGKAGDLLNLVSKNQGRKMYLFDLTRSKPAELSQADLYAAIEAIKDGHFANLKYETSTVMMAPAHCVVFANEWPDISALSKDRWDFYTVESRREACQPLRRVRIQQVWEIFLQKNSGGPPGARAGKPKAASK